MKEINVIFNSSHQTVRLIYVQHELSPKNLFLTKFGDFFMEKDLHLESPLQDFIYNMFFV